MNHPCLYPTTTRSEAVLYVCYCGRPPPPPNRRHLCLVPAVVLCPSYCSHTVAMYSVTSSRLSSGGFADRPLPGCSWHGSVSSYGHPVLGCGCFHKCRRQMPGQLHLVATRRQGGVNEFEGSMFCAGCRVEGNPYLNAVSPKLDNVGRLVM